MEGANKPNKIVKSLFFNGKFKVTAHMWKGNYGNQPGWKVKRVIAVNEYTIFEILRSVKRPKMVIVNTYTADLKRWLLVYMATKINNGK